MLHLFRKNFKPVVCRSALQAHTKSRPLAIATLLGLFPLLILPACSSRLDNAPVLDRSPRSGGLFGVPTGYYRVKTGDTLYRIAVENGQSYQAIAAWNNLQNPKQIEVGQLLRVAPLGKEATAGSLNAAAQNRGQNGNASPQAQPFNTAPIPFASSTNPANTNTPSASGDKYSKTDKSTTVGSTTGAAVGNIAFIWPVTGRVLNTFNESENKGINIGGIVGTPVKAASGGRIVYAGNGLRRYGNLIIIKHDNLFLSAYAHNHLLHVKEGDIVQKGQKIAEMGSSDATRVMLHFEIRKQGKPVDPLQYLPNSSLSDNSASISKSQAP